MRIAELGRLAAWATGQSTVEQMRVFSEMGRRDGGIGTGFGLPVHPVGAAERAENLRPFDAREFAQGVVGG